MLWAALATLIMSLSGFGDDARAIELFLSQLKVAVNEHVAAKGHRERALAAIDAMHNSFQRHREELRQVDECLARVDARYAVSVRSYEVCTADRGRADERVVQEFQRAGHVLEENISKQEWSELSAELLENDYHESIDVSLRSYRSMAGERIDTRRLPGLVGVYSQRHLTTARNAIQILSGPLAQQTFGQLYQQDRVSPGVTFEQGEGQTHWGYRAGVAFGLYEDIEVGALFLPFELTPKFKTNDILVFFSYQYRSEFVDTALRFSLLAPEDRILPVNPGISVLLHDAKRRLELGALLPIELNRGQTRAGLNLPLRASYQWSPHFFTTLESGYAWRDFQTLSHQSPLGFGLGTTWLFGSRVVDVTTLFLWDEFIRYADISQRGPDLARYRISFGLNIQSMVF